MRRKIRTGILILLLCLSSARLAPAGEPLEFVRTAIEKAVQVLKDPKLQPQDRKNERIDRLREVLNPIFDYDEMAKRALVRRLTGREVGRNRIIPGIIDELNECGLRVQSYFFISRWFSGSVLILARCVGPTVPEAAIQAPQFRSAE
jgi:hypothetical protein